MFIRILAIFLTLLVGLPVSAQSPAPFGNRDLDQTLENTFHPPKIFVLDVKITEQNDDKITGTFTALSRDDYAVGDIRFRSEVWGLLPKTGLPEGFPEDVAAEHVLLYDRHIQEQTVTLLPNESITVPFTHTLATPLPPGAYTLQTQVITGKGRRLGWNVAPFTTTGASPFVHLVPGTLGLPEFPDQNIEALAGPNVDPSSDFTVHATAINESAQTMTVTPTLTTYEFSSVRGNPQITTYDPITIRPGESQPLELPVTAAQKPKVYSSYLSLTANRRPVSSLAEYRWVVRGADADVMYARLVNLGTKPGNDTYVRLDYVGAGDAETKVEGQLFVTLDDSQGELGAFNPVPVSLTDGIQSGFAPIRLTRPPVGDIAVKTRLVDSANAVLDEYEVPFSLSDAQKETLAKTSTLGVRFNRYASTYIVPGLTILILAVALGGWAWWHKRSPSKNRKKRK